MNDEDKIDFKEITKGFKDSKNIIFNLINKDRYKVLNDGYKFDKYIFQIIMFGLFGLMFFIAYSNNFELNYFKCGNTIDPNIYYPQSLDCVNPFYEPTDWTNEATLPPGEYGFKAGPLFNNLGVIAIVLFIIGFLLNHLIYNKYFFKNEML